MIKIKLWWYGLLLKTTQRDLEYFDSDIANQFGHFDKDRKKYVSRIEKLQLKIEDLEELDEFRK